MKKAVLISMMSLLAACGGSSSSPTPTATPTPPPPNAAVSANGNGNLVVHPSAVSTFALAFEAPVRVRETGGGTADWNFVRLQFFNASGREIERTEFGADVIRTAGANRINPNSDASYRLALRFNSDDFEDLTITLGFTDVASGRAFTANVPLSSFADITVSFAPFFRDGPTDATVAARLQQSFAKARAKAARR